MRRGERLGGDKHTAEYNAWIARSERLASRAYAVQAMFLAVDDWADKARDEADRTRCRTQACSPGSDYSAVGHSNTAKTS